MNSQSKLQRWERRAEWPLACVAIVFLGVYSVQVLAQPHGFASHLLDSTMYVLYVTFVIDYIARFTLADQRTWWFFRNLLDLAIVALPFFRPLRILRVVILVEVLQRMFGDAFRGRIVGYTASTAVLLIYAASLAVLQPERPHLHANIKNFGDAVWWAFTTITTVGYGDFYPITPMGRVIAVLLMVGGITLIGVITATVVTWIVQRVADVDSAQQAATAGHIERLRDDIAQLTQAVTEMRRDNGRGESAPV
jgi:voltage-gated potassium channel